LINAYRLINDMRNFDSIDLDPRAMRAFLAIYEKGSLTEASELLGVSQSALSHTLAKLRKIFSDPLFLRTGRGVIPSSRAERLVAEIREILDAVSRLASDEEFDPASYRGNFSLGLTGYETQWLAPRIFKRFRHEAPHASLALRPRRGAGDNTHVEDEFDVVLTRLGGPENGVFVEQFWVDRYVTFYDAASRSAPRSLKEFLEAPQAAVVWGDNPRTVLDAQLHRRGLRRNVVLQVPDFDSVSVLLRGTDVVITLPLLLSKGLMQGFAYVACPVKLPPMPCGMVWHARNQHDPAQKWLRGLISSEAAQLVPP